MTALQSISYLINIWQFCFTFYSCSLSSGVPLYQAIHSARCSGQQRVFAHPNPWPSTQSRHNSSPTPGLQRAPWFALKSQTLCWYCCSWHYKASAYFNFMTYCLISKLRSWCFPHISWLWNLFQPKLSEPAIATNHNKQALLSFWYNVLCDCQSVNLLFRLDGNQEHLPSITCTDHDDQDVVLFNRGMLPAYYGILRLCWTVSCIYMTTGFSPEHSVGL